MPVIINGSSGITNVNGTASAPAETGTTSTNTGMWFPAANTVAWSTNGTEAMRIDSSQNVGIGTNSPGARLTVADAYTTGSRGNFYVYTTNTATADYGAALSLGGSYSGTSEAPFGSIAARWTGSGINGYMQFYTLNTGTLTERMRLDSSGNLGLGGTPSAWGAGSNALQVVSGNITVNNTLYLLANQYYNGSVNKYINNGFAGYYSFNNSNGQHQWYNSGSVSGTAGNTVTNTQAMTLDASGNLLVNGTSAGALLNSGIQVGTASSATGAAGRQVYVAPNFIDGDYLSAYNIGGGNNDGRVFFGALAGRSGTAATAKVVVGFDAPNGASITGAIGTASNHPLSFGTNSVERARIDTSGNLLVGKTSENVSSTVGCEMRPDGVISAVSSSSTSAAASYYAYSTGAGAYRFYVDWGGTVHATSTSITAISDQSLKTNIKPLETGLAEVMKLQPRRYDWINGDGTNKAGFIAQEVEQVLPDLVAPFKYNDEETKLGLKMGDMIPTLVKAIQELKAELDALKAKVTP